MTRPRNYDFPHEDRNNHPKEEVGHKENNDYTLAASSPTGREWNRNHDENEELRTDGETAAGRENYWNKQLASLSSEASEIYSTITDKEIWDDSQYGLEPNVDDEEFTARDVAEAVDDPTHWNYYNWSRVDNALQEAEENGLMESRQKRVDIDQTTGGEHYFEVTFYRVKETGENGPAGI